MESTIQIRELTLDDYEDILELLRVTPGVTLRRADSRDAIASYLERNPGLSFVAMNDRELIGCVLCGHDGRRGYLQHLMVKPLFRNKGVGEALFSSCIAALGRIGIFKTHIFVFKSNATANEFWTKKGWELRQDVNMYSFNSSSDNNA